MATAIAMMVGGAIVNAIAFSGSNFLFSSLKKSEIDAERKRHDLALEELTKARDEWSRKRSEYLDYLNERLQKEAHAKQQFSSIDNAMQEYYIMTGTRLDLPSELSSEPQLSDFYTPDDDQKIRELVFILLGLGVTGLVTYKIIN